MNKPKKNAPQNFDQTEPADLLNIAALCPSTSSLGPGKRAVLWVQGCFFRCPGCIAPDWIPIQPARMATVDELVDELLADPTVTGLTFSGGEPMLQAMPLARLARKARQVRDLNIICFSGFTLAHLQRVPPGPGVDDLLQQIDVLIDGPYIEQLNNNRGLRGSTNQQVHFFSDRLKGFDFTGDSRRVEIHLAGNETLLVGVPPLRLKSIFNEVLDQAVGPRGRAIEL